ncbi:MAG TPA: hypothetical protein VN878_01255 [Usitatibacter sp.]|nr:hypothetical protein [Usitatibacter sp.]
MSSGDNDVLGKADALLRRHSISAPASGADSGSVPILTDLVDATPAAPDARGEIARTAGARALAEGEARLAAEIEHRLMEQLVPRVHAAVASALADLHPELVKTVERAIAEALKNAQVK